jgi:phage tail P2-like protein
MDLGNISILNLMPVNLAADKNIQMMAEAFDEVLRDIIKKIPDVEIISNLALKRIVNETLIDLLAWQFHVDFYEPRLPIEIKRELVLKSLDWHYRKGTPSVVEEIVSTVFTKAKIQEWYEYGGLPYRFRIATEEDIPDAEAMKKFVRAINSGKNTRSFLDNLTYLIDFLDEVIMKEAVEINVTKDMSDSFRSVGLKFNGRAKHDGHTLNDTEWLPIKADGSYRFNGERKHRAELVPATSFVRIPIRAGSGILDSFKLGINTGNYTEEYHTHLKHNGMIKADGSHKFNGLARSGDLPVSMKIKLDQADREAMAESSSVKVIKQIEDKAPTRWRFDGTFKHDGAITASASREKLVIAIKGLDFIDEVNMSDTFTIGMRYVHKHDGTYKANGDIKFNSGILIPL